jgi:hypothetical protein
MAQQCDADDEERHGDREGERGPARLVHRPPPVEGRASKDDATARSRRYAEGPLMPVSVIELKMQ